MKIALGEAPTRILIRPTKAAEAWECTDPACDYCHGPETD